MAKVRIGFSTQFELENELVGIGTDNPTNTLQALGNIHSSNAKAVGVSTLTTFDGFVDTKASISGLEGSEQGSISGEIIIEGSVDVSTGTTFRSGPENLTVTDSFTLPGISEDKPSVGTTRFNENLRALEFYTGSEWRAVNSYVDMGNRGRGLWMTAFNDVTNEGLMDSIQMSTSGNSIEFGQLTATFYGTGFSNAIRGLHAGGSSTTNTIEYVTIASRGDGIDFGDLTTTSSYRSLSFSSSTRGFRAGGANPGNLNVVDYVEIMTTGNASDFGDLMYGTAYAGGCSSSTRGLTMGGGYSSPSYIPDIEMVTMASKGNAVKFGDLTSKVEFADAASNSVRGIRFGGRHTSGGTDSMDYVTIASEGNAIDFGQLGGRRFAPASLASQTRAFSSGGYDGTNRLNIIEYVNIASTGNSISFGERCKNGCQYATGCSDSHGGLGGF